MICNFIIRGQNRGINHREKLTDGLRRRPSMSATWISQLLPEHPQSLLMGEAPLSVDLSGTRLLAIRRESARVRRENPAMALRNLSLTSTAWPDIGVSEEPTEIRP